MRRADTNWNTIFAFQSFHFFAGFQKRMPRVKNDPSFVYEDTNHLSQDLKWQLTLFLWKKVVVSVMSSSTESNDIREPTTQRRMITDMAPVIKILTNTILHGLRLKKWRVHVLCYLELYDWSTYAHRVWPNTEHKGWNTISKSGLSIQACWIFAEFIPPVRKSVAILLFIGRDLLPAHYVLEQPIWPMHAPFLQRLRLGWMVIGNICLDTTHQQNPISAIKNFTLTDGRTTLLKPCQNSIYVEENHVFSITSEYNLPGLSIDEKNLPLLTFIFFNISRWHKC